MMTEICQYLHNWFDRDQPKFYGKFEIKDGDIISFNDGDMGLKVGQYFRIQGSVLSEGVFLYPPEDLPEEVFEGAVWSMAVPPAIRVLAADIKAWCDKYQAVDSVAMSPYTSEAFGSGGYSYSKSGGGASDGSASCTWQCVFANRLNPWRKLP